MCHVVRTWRIGEQGNRVTGEQRDRDRDTVKAKVKKAPKRGTLPLRVSREA